MNKHSVNEHFNIEKVKLLTEWCYFNVSCRIPTVLHSGDLKSSGWFLDGLKEFISCPF